MLNGMAAFVGCDGSGGNTGAIIDIMAKIERLVNWIVMVGQRAVNFMDRYVANIVVAQHLLRHLATCHVVVHAYP